MHDCTTIERFTQRLADLVARAQEDGRAEGIAPEAVAAALMASLLSLSRALLARHPDRPLTDVAADLRALFGPLLRTPTPVPS